MTNSRQKGARFERLLASKLREYGFDDARRGVQYCGMTGAADVVGLPGIHIEAKHNEHLNIFDAMDQSVRDAKNGEIPVVIHKKNNTDILCTMKLSDWIDIYREWVSGFDERLCKDSQKDN